MVPFTYGVRVQHGTTGWFDTHNFPCESAPALKATSKHGCDLDHSRFGGQTSMTIEHPPQRERFMGLGGWLTTVCSSFRCVNVGCCVVFRTARWAGMPTCPGSWWRWPTTCMSTLPVGRGSAISVSTCTGSLNVLPTWIRCPGLGLSRPPRTVPPLPRGGGGRRGRRDALSQRDRAALRRDDRRRGCRRVLDRVHSGSDGDVRERRVWAGLSAAGSAGGVIVLGGMRRCRGRHLGVRSHLRGLAASPPVVSSIGPCTRTVSASSWRWWVTLSCAAPWRPRIPSSRGPCGRGGSNQPPVHGPPPTGG